MMYNVGFEPTRISPTVLKTVAMNQARPIVPPLNSYQNSMDLQIFSFYILIFLFIY